MEVLPFTASHAFMAEEDYISVSVQGLLRIEDDALVLEYRETDTDLSGIHYSQRTRPVEELRIPLERVRSMTVRRRYLLVPVCEIEVDRLNILESLTWAAGTLLRLRIPYGKFHEARDLAASLSLIQADARLRELGESDLAG